MDKFLKKLNALKLFRVLKSAVDILHKIVLTIWRIAHMMGRKSQQMSDMSRSIKTAFSF